MELGPPGLPRHDMTDLRKCTARHARLPYKPLNQLCNEIRLLKLLRVDDYSKQVICELEHVSLKELRTYKALSYCWGSPCITCPIQVNGHEMHVTENLEAALRESIRQGCFCLWVDAICINQADLDERGRQVLRMGDIYANASETIAWLGIEADNSTLAMSLIHILSRSDLDGKDVELVKYEEAMSRLYQPSTNHRYEDHWTALKSLCDRLYWRRIWIIQEIAFAPKVVIRCGSQNVAWDDMVKAITEIPTAGGRSRSSVVVQTFHVSLPPISPISRLRELIQEAEGRYQFSSLLSVLRRSNNALATNPLDKIYGILAMTKDGHELVPAPDYTLTVEQVCRMTTTAIVRASRDLDIICYGKTQPSLILQSWVPDWSNQLPSTMVSDIAGDDLFNATGRSTATEYLRTSHLGEFKENDLVIKAQGFVFDMLNGLGAWTASGIEEKGYGLVQPDQFTSPYGSEPGIFKALSTSLVLGNRAYQSNDSEFLNSLYVMVASSDNSKIAETFSVVLGSWYSENKHFKIHHRTIRDWFKMFTADSSRPERDMSDLTAREMAFLEDVQLTTISKRLVFTHGGYLGMAPHEARKRDKVCLLLGCRVPVVLREREGGGYELVGEVYVHGIMNGEAMTKENEGKLRDFCIH